MWAEPLLSLVSSIVVSVERRVAHRNRQVPCDLEQRCPVQMALQAAEAILSSLVGTF